VTRARGTPGRPEPEPAGASRAARRGPDLTTAVAGFAFVLLYVLAFALGIEVGASDRAILEHYADSGNRVRELVAFFLIAGAALAFVGFAAGLRARIDLVEAGGGRLGPLAWAGGIACATLILAGNAVSRAPALAAMNADEFQLDPNTRRLTEAAGFLLFVGGALAAILLVASVSVAAVRAGALPRWLGWAGLVAAALLPLAIGFIGFLVLLAWVMATSTVLAFGRGREAGA
jgi:hypothetical protein